MSSLPRWLAALAVAIFLLVLLAAEFAYRAPAAKGADAPANEFSAERAHGVLTQVLGQEAPHPLGSAANADVRQRIGDQLESLGLEVEQQTTLVTRRGAVARVHNLLARIDGQQPGNAVLLAAHHDSVGAGPGACDDGVAVAAMIETARALLAGPKLRRPVILLIDDGEELGLFGARAFCTQHPWAKEVAAVLNFEARGTSGASLLFETAGDDLTLLRHAAQALARPITGSAFAAVYRTLPNSTDLAVFRQHMPGLNFAFIGGARRYHTPLDDVAHADLGSLQHHGDNMLAMARRLANDDDLGGSAAGRAVFFDLLGRVVVVLPARYELPAAAGVLLVWLLTCMAKWRCGTLRGWPLLAGVVAMPVALIAAAAFGLALSSVSIGLGSLPTPFPPRPVVHALGYALGGFSAGLVIARAISGATDALYLFVGVAGFTAVVGLALAIAFPGASYVCVIPAAFAVLGTLCTRRPGVWLGVFACLVATASALVMAPFHVLLPTAIGLRAGAVHAAVAAWATIALGAMLPALFGAYVLRAALVCALAAACAVALAALQPAHDRDHPARANIVYVQAANQTPVWSLDDAEPFAPWPAQRRSPLPWERPGLSLDAPDLSLPAPVGEVAERKGTRGKQTIRGTMASSRGAPWLTLWLSPGLTVVKATLAGVEVEIAPASRSASGWRSLSFLGAQPDEVIDFEVTAAGTSKLPPWVADRTLGLLPEAADLARRRTLALAAPIHLGDGVVVAAPLDGW